MLKETCVDLIDRLVSTPASNEQKPVAKGSLHEELQSYSSGDDAENARTPFYQSDSDSDQGSKIVDLASDSSDEPTVGEQRIHRINDSVVLH